MSSFKEYTEKILELENMFEKLWTKIVDLGRISGKDNIQIIPVIEVNDQENITTLIFEKLNHLLGINICERDLSYILNYKYVKTFQN